MLKAMLEERFGLQARIATKKVEVIALQMAKPDTLGPGLRVSTGSCSGSSADALPNEAVRSPSEVGRGPTDPPMVPASDCRAAVENEENRREGPDDDPRWRRAGLTPRR